MSSLLGWLSLVKFDSLCAGQMLKRVDLPEVLIGVSEAPSLQQNSPSVQVSATKDVCVCVGRAHCLVVLK